jgi:hypothetical protein
LGFNGSRCEIWLASGILMVIKFKIHNCSPLTRVNIYVNLKSSCIFGGTVSIGQLDRIGSERIWETYTSNNRASLDLKDIRCSGSLHHEELLADADSLLPDGQLIILVKVTIYTKSSLYGESFTEPRLTSQEFNQSNVMMDNFVDLGADSVLLVFEDGEERCHTFPLAAREDNFTV